jgi:glutathione S-transferase
MFIRIYIYIITTGVARQDAHQNRRARARVLPRANFSPSTLHQTLLSEHNLLLSNDDENGEERERKREARERGRERYASLKKIHI